MYEVRNINDSRPNPRRRGKIKLNFYFHASLWCLKAFYKGLKGLKFLFQYSFQEYMGPEGYDINSCHAEELFTGLFCNRKQQLNV